MGSCEISASARKRDETQFSNATLRLQEVPRLIVAVSPTGDRHSPHFVAPGSKVSAWTNSPLLMISSKTITSTTTITCLGRCAPCVSAWCTAPLMVQCMDEESPILRTTDDHMGLV